MLKKDLKKYLLTVAVFLFVVFIQTTNAQKFSATVDKTTVGQYDQFQVYFTFDGGDINGLSNFRPPAFGGFKILSGPNQSSSMQIINGKVSGSITYSYILQPTNIGSYSIGSASVEYGGKSYNTNTLNVKVEKGTPQQQKESNGGYSQQELAKNVFIVAEANKTRAALGEQITVTYKLYTKLNIASPQITKLPSYEGFWAEDLGPIQNINFQIGMYKGERYRMAVIKQVALFPSKTGTLSVTPFELNIPVIVKKKKTGNDVFDEFFNDSFFGRTQTVNYDAKSNTIKVEVEPLPANAPSSFAGAVGNFTLKADLDKTNVVTNESLTLRLTIGGNGNIKLLKVPEPQLPAGFDKYEPKTIDNVNRNSIISGQKIVDYLIVPRSPGQKEIPPVEFTYYNPSSKKYVTLKTQSFKINVRQGVGDNNVASQSYSKEDVKLLSEDIRYIKTSDFKLEPRHEISLIKPWFWISVVVPFLGLFGAVSFKKRQDKLYGNVQLLRYQKAEKAARKRLKLSKAALDGGKISEFYSELSFALFGYLEDKLAIQKSEFTLEGAVNELTIKSVSEDLIDRVKLIAEKCEYVRFAPQGETSASAQEIYDEAVKVIVELDSSIDTRKKR
ncbi:MAG: BatD family protein [Bacteroidetes bacterium]|nr:BatD family protein [Bacteroidota bacterium]